MIDNSHFRRYELKYVVSEATAAEIRNYIRHFCVLDPHTPSGQHGYIVNNLYFDTPNRQFYTDTKFRKLTRYKLRARFYGYQAGEFIWPEIKYRHANIIWKKRSAVRVEEWPELFSVYPSERLQPQINSGINSFEEMIYWHNASSVVHVRYFREAYASVLDEYGRITFDRRLCYRMLNGSTDLQYREEEMMYYDDPVTINSSESDVILEIKVKTMIPSWVIHLIQLFHLKQRPFSKYCYSIDHNAGNTISERNSRQFDFRQSGLPRQNSQPF